jgi:hypothetical protein
MNTFLISDRADELEREIMRREVEGLDTLARRLAKRDHTRGESLRTRTRRTYRVTETPR